MNTEMEKIRDLYVLYLQQRKKLYGDVVDMPAEAISQKKG